MNKLELMKTANEVRKGVITATHSAKSGHPGGSLSLIFCLIHQPHFLLWFAVHVVIITHLPQFSSDNP